MKCVTSPPATGCSSRLTQTSSGVFSESVSVTEGDSVTLSVNLTEVKDKISWKFGAQDVVIAEINVVHDNMRLYEERPDGRFRDRLKLDQTGSLIITNITNKHSGLYQVINTNTGKQLNIFNITAYAHLSVPVITRDSSSSSSKCSVLCSVMNVSHVSLSWYKRKSLLSSISVSEHRNINISLHLECLDDSYTCVINNPITNQTQHLNTDVCHKCSGVFSESVSVTEGDSVTLSVDLTEVKDKISWKFGAQEVVIAEIIVVNKNINKILHKERPDGRFRDRLKLDQTGSLIITNITNTHSGLYKVINTTSGKQLNMQHYCLCSSACSCHLQLFIIFSVFIVNLFSVVFSDEYVSEEDNICKCTFTEAVIRLVVSALVGVAAVAVVVYDVRSRRDEQKKKRSYQKIRSDIELNTLDSAGC
ncbi:uncharacterized protein LOC130429866 [Triplophysa dalaica]|uniref:uncharacterized protein LOC130429866 n=1 Tax=Triplophysa dalaica TaxID=1582913 RepID=UPI0024DFD87A|nr:uncharacterized protein LOC130429866 [Triplophysa dalaica]